MKISDIFEAGEPSNPSRRGFLKKAAAVGATAATNPSSLLKGVGQSAKSVASPLAAALSQPISIESRLVSGAGAWIAKNMGDIWIPDSMWGDDENDRDEKDIGAGETRWVPGKNDELADYVNDPNSNSFKGGEGTTPWGNSYALNKTPGGLPYVYIEQDGYNNLLTYMDKSGNIKTRKINNRYSDATDKETEFMFGLEVGSFIDDLENGTLDLEAGAYPERHLNPVINPTNDTPSTSNTIGSMAKRGVLSTLGKKLFKNDTPDKSGDTSNLPHASGIDKTQALPAPDKPDELFTTDLQRMKDLAGVKRNKN